MMNEKLTPVPTTMLIAGAIAGAVSFVVSVASSSTQTVDGHIVASTHRDWVAVGCGVAAAVAGAVTAILAMRSRRVWIVGAAVLVVALGGLQLARGYGAFQSRSDVRSSNNTSPAQAPSPVDLAPCSDGDACDLASTRLQKTDPARAQAARSRSCFVFKHMYACHDAGVVLLAGKDVARDAPAAFAHWMKACELGHHDGCHDAGTMLWEGDGIAFAKDRPRALALMERACKGGVKLSCKDLATFHRDGTEVARDAAKAFAYAVQTCDVDGNFGTSVAEGIGAMCMHAAEALRTGNGTKQDTASAANYVAKAAAYFRTACPDHPWDCHSLAFVIDEGLVTSPDLARARKLYERACDVGRLASCYNLGLMLEEGRGGSKDVVKARKLFDRACRWGIDIACKKLETSR